jgi:hypothetical protein
MAAGWADESGVGQFEENLTQELKPNVDIAGLNVRAEAHPSN